MDSAMLLNSHFVSCTMMCGTHTLTLMNLFKTAVPAVPAHSDRWFNNLHVFQCTVQTYVAPMHSSLLYAIKMLASSSALCVTLTGALVEQLNILDITIRRCAI